MPTSAGYDFDYTDGAPAAAQEQVTTMQQILASRYCIRGRDPAIVQVCATFGDHTPTRGLARDDSRRRHQVGNGRQRAGAVCGLTGAVNDLADG
jgi:hypothetical protein